MRIIDVLTSPWAIAPEKYEQICGIYASHLRGEKIDIKAIEANLGEPLNNVPTVAEIVGSVAVLPIEGVLANKMNLFQKISGGTSFQMLTEQFNMLMADESIDTIILDIDSPGGTVAGTQEFANLVYNARDKKRIIAFANPMAASAAYWVASAAGEVYVSSQSASVGSIGVVTTHTDVSESEKAQGIKTTVISAGKYKAIGNEHEPLSDDALEVIKSSLEESYSIFVEAVAKHRGADVAAVRLHMAEGRVFSGREAEEVGLVDGETTLQALINNYNTEGNVQMSTDNNNPDTTAISEAAANAERQRIQEIMNLPRASAYAAMVQEMAFNGASKETVMMAILKADEESNAKAAKAIQDDSASLITSVVPNALPAEPTQAAKDDWSNEDVRAEFNNDEAAYNAYMKANEAGLIKYQVRNK
jgi:signal peptide peptidase SppA